MDEEAWRRTGLRGDAPHLTPKIRTSILACVLRAAYFALVGLGLLAFAVVVAVGERGARRLLALVPVGTALAIIAFVPAGGPVMAARLAAAAVALIVSTHSGAQLARRRRTGPDGAAS